MNNNVKSTNSDDFVENTQFVDTVTANQSVDNQPSIDPSVIEKLKSNQSLLGGFLGGFLGATAGAIVWALVTAITHYEIGYIAIAVGFLTGFMVKKLGHGFQQHFGYIGAFWSLIGCFVGNILAVLIMISDGSNISILKLIDVDFISYIIEDTFSPFDLVFYLIAVYEGYHFSFMTKLEVAEKLNKIINSKAAYYSIIISVKIPY
ncbi:MAG: hypothetical protein AB6733_06725 [Clostridiaceae bacterium]